VFTDYPLEKLIPAIDWNPFFQVWQLRGKYPNRNYPKLFNEAQEFLARSVKEKLLVARGICAFYPAHGKGDDIELYSNESRSDAVGTLYGLRQQEMKQSEDAYHAIGDFIAPKESGVKDYIGMFAVSAGFGCAELAAKYEAAHDDYNAIMLKALADRLAEAFAEVLHAEVRRDHWGYAEDEAKQPMSAEDLHKIKYRGIRPAPGYPMQPDHTEKRTIWKLMDVKAKTGIELSDHLAMFPAASVSGLYLANPESKYFVVGKLTLDQVTEYAARKGMNVPDVEKMIPNALAYDEANE